MVLVAAVEGEARAAAEAVKVVVVTGEGAARKEALVRMIQRR